MQVLGVRDAIGSNWAYNFRSWLFLFGPTALLAWLWDYQRVPFPVWGVLVVSTLTQHLAAGPIMLVVALIARRRTTRLPMAVVYGMWTAIGAVRGLLGGFFAATFAGVPAEYASRTASWVLVSWVWFPMLTYALALLDQRRRLLATFAIESSRRDAELERVGQSASVLRGQLVTRLQRSVGPVIEEIKASLIAASRELDPDSFQAISARLGAIADRAGTLVTEIESEPPPRAAIEGPRSAPISRAIDFDQTRPVLTAASIFAAIIPLLIPDTYRPGGLLEAANLLGAVACGIVILTILLFLARRWAPLLSYAPRMLSVLSCYVVAGAVAAATFYAFTGTAASAREMTLVFYLPLAFAVASVSVSAVTGLAPVNAAVITAIETVQTEIDQLHESAALAEANARQQLVTLMHGPVQGRLSACAMALNFHANDKGLDPQRTAVLTSTVLQHLAAASSDLMLLGSVSEPTPGPTMTHGVWVD